MSNPCERHSNVKADGYCPVCLTDENADLREQLAEAEKREQSMYEKYVATKEFYANRLAEARRRVVELEKKERRLKDMMPLFTEARDALPAISLASAKLRGLDLSLGDRMDAVGVMEDWEKMDAIRALSAPQQPAPDSVEVPISQIKHWCEYWNGDRNDAAMSDALEFLINEFDNLLTAAKEQT